MFTAIVWLTVIVSIFMVGAVLVQRSKGGGLNQNFAAQTQIMGVRKSADFIEKATWTLASILFVLSLASVAFLPSHNATIGSSEIDDIMPRTESAAPIQSFDAQAPVSQDEAPAQDAAPAAESAPAQD